MDHPLRSELACFKKAIAALSLDHRFIGCEIAPDHFEVACQRA